MSQCANNNYKATPVLDLAAQFNVQKLILEHAKYIMKKFRYHPNDTAPPEVKWIGHLGVYHGMTIISSNCSSLRLVSVLKNIFQINTLGQL